MEEEWLTPTAALALIHGAYARGVEVGGLDAVFVPDKDGYNRLSLSDSWDYTIAAWPKVPDRYAHAVAWIEERANIEGIHFSVFLDEPSRGRRWLAYCFSALKVPKRWVHKR